MQVIQAMMALPNECASSTQNTDCRVANDGVEAGGDDIKGKTKAPA
jgi:hypothetical protein